MTISIGNPIIDIILNGVISIITWMFSGMIGFAIPWLVFKIDSRNRVHTTEGRYTTGGKVVGLIIAGIIISGIINLVCSAVFQTALEVYIGYLIAITLTTFMVFAVWIGYTFHADLKPYRKIFAMLTVIVLLNIVVVNASSIGQAIAGA